MVIVQQTTAEPTGPRGRPFQGTPDWAALRYSAVGRFTARGGRELIVPPFQERTARSIATIVLGTALTHLLRQRALVPLHAAAVVLNGCAFALAGPWGIGKSALLDAFIRAGHRFMADDLCAVELPPDAFPGRSATRTAAARWAADSGSSETPNAEIAAIPDQRCTADALHRVRETNPGHAIALPCGLWLKLRDDMLNDRYAGAGRFKAPGNKTWVDLAGQFHAEPAPLAGILLIADGAHDDSIQIERLTGIKAVSAAPLVISRWRQAKASQGLAVLSDHLVALLRLVPLYRLCRPRTHGRLDEVVASLERFAAEPIAGGCADVRIPRSIRVPTMGNAGHGLFVFDERESALLPTLLRIFRYGLDPITVEATEHYRLMREFCADPQGFVAGVLAD